MKSAIARLVVAVTLVCAVVANAQPLDPSRVPQPLRPWVDWALEGHEIRNCPLLSGSSTAPSEEAGRPERRCLWPSRLALQLDDQGGRFTQRWRTFTAGFLALPGDLKHWPLDVRVGGRSAVVVARNGRPAVQTAPGRHSVSGSFLWDGLPDGLTVPGDTALVGLTVRGQAIAFPRRDARGRVSLQQRQGPARAEDRLDLRVQRKLIDDIPFRIQTRMMLNVAGKHREAVLEGVLPAGFLPMQLDSPLPARIEPDGRLKLQVRAGTWTVTLVARSRAGVNSLARPTSKPPWPKSEIWVFESKPALREAQVKGVVAIDPQQTALPEAWKRLPSYRVLSGETLVLEERRRGDGDAPEDRLALSRDIWVDFDGGGATVADELTGQLSRSWRLEAQPELALGRVAINGDNQFITRRDPKGPQGVEVRQRRVSMQAESRLEGDVSDQPVVGWAHDMRSVRANLHLPPGWNLLHSAGPDKTEATWIGRWELMDIFLLVLIAFAMQRLFGWIPCLVAVVALGLTLTEPEAPRWIWLVVLALEGLRRVVDEGWVAGALRVSRLTAGVLLLLFAVPFAVHQLRAAIYPSLELARAGSLGDGEIFGAAGFGETLRGQLAAPSNALGGEADVSLVAPQAPPPGQGEMAVQATSEPHPKDGKMNDMRHASRASGVMKKVIRGKGRRAGSGYGLSSSSWRNALNLVQQDPAAVVQTGPGRPRWRWRTVSLIWSGPVRRDERLSLWLLPPWLNRLLGGLRVIGLAALVLLMLIRWRGRGGGFSSALGLGLGLVLLAPAPAAWAEVPSDQTLEQLRTRLTAPERCAPHCASIDRLHLQVSPAAARMRLEIGALAHAAVPLPGHVDHWLPTEVLLDGRPAEGLSWHAERLWLSVPAGRHQVVLTGPLPEKQGVQIALPLKPHRVRTEVSGWRVDGVHEDGQVDTSLQLTRLAQAGGAKKLISEALPSFVRIERSLLLGLTWEVETKVVRLTPVGTSVMLRVPLLRGESVTTGDIRVSKGHVLVNLGLKQGEVRWRSTLAKRAQLDLQASNRTAWVEQWQVSVGPIWHVDTQGIPPVQSTSEKDTGRLWRPWPGEQVTLVISRPKGVKGQTLTIDSAHMRVVPGTRATEVTATLSLRSSRGIEHTFKLPAGAKLQSVEIDGKTRHLRQRKDAVTVPVVPGAQRVVLRWQQEGGMSAVYRAPTFDLGVPAVNATTEVRPPSSRWTLFLWGPRLGPAVLFWSKLGVLLIVALILGRVRITPLGVGHWFLLGIGLAMAPFWAAAIVGGWLLVCGWRARSPDWGGRGLFNLRQLAILGWTGVAMIVLVWALHQGLLGHPDMQVEGNGSSSYVLKWFADRTAGVMPRPLILSVPVLVYRLSMLAWALWLAYALLGWLRWGWGGFVAGGGWRRPAPEATASPAAPLAQSADDSASSATDAAPQ